MLRGLVAHAAEPGGDRGPAGLPEADLSADELEELADIAEGIGQGGL
ncbi:hypothetical protein AB0J52_40500 [Spirillospora sp. NPDC049652]